MKGGSVGVLDPEIGKDGETPNLAPELAHRFVVRPQGKPCVAPVIGKMDRHRIPRGRRNRYPPGAAHERPWDHQQQQNRRPTEPFRIIAPMFHVIPELIQSVSDDALIFKLRSRLRAAAIS